MTDASTRYAFLRSRRWAGIMAVAVIVSLTCAMLGYWQLTRYQGKAEAAALVEANYDSRPVALTELLPTAHATWPENLTWRQVTVTGEYLVPAVVLPQRPIGGSPADHVLAALAVQVEDEEEPWWLLVDRGWYRSDAFGDHTAEQELPEGEVTVTIHLRAAEPPSERDLSGRQVYAINPSQVLDVAAPGADLAGTVVTGAYGVLVEESPTTATPPAPLPRPSADLGNHLSYAFQWWVFALGALVGIVVLARREAIALAGPEVAAVAPSQAGATASYPGTRRPRRRTEADEEDAIIDAQLEAARRARVEVEPGRTGDDQASETSSR
ncbi:SURF1 family protein [Ruania alkalisoli]|uniref:SURF1-like protein n=1 Tax=Ruania alkalisoli TaxID=2779775 RepID=A0A7M1SXJ5_9MICO|nr:SURF1 family protein [Ruania alkalisoli]QOR72241.1 SURF1 family protein [Ruania alkalisoli]